MGSPIFDVIVEFVLQKLEHWAVQGYRPMFWVRYVDETFAIIEHNHLCEFHKRLNRIFLDT